MTMSGEISQSCTSSRVGLEGLCWLVGPLVGVDNEEKDSATNTIGVTCSRKARSSCRIVDPPYGRMSPIGIVKGWHIWHVWYEVGNGKPSASWHLGVPDNVYLVYSEGSPHRRGFRLLWEMCGGGIGCATKFHRTIVPTSLYFFCPR